MIWSVGQRLTIEPLLPSNVPEVASLWPDRAAFSESEFKHALIAAATLLADDRAQGAIIRDNGRACAVGLTVFVNETFSDALLAEPAPHIGKHLLLTSRYRSSPILTVSDIGVRNASGGLQMVVVLTHIDPMATDRPSVLGKVIKAFVDFHAGFRIARIINQVFGVQDISDVRTSNSFELVAEWNPDTSAAAVASALFTLTREEAVARRSVFLPMFVYDTPRVVFSAEQRELLRAALDGDTDEYLAARLGISTSAVKARWRRIQQRAISRHPTLFDRIDDGTTNRRGPQVRHIVLRYVRSTPSELRPYDERADSVHK
jgi:hypothetical protein